MKRKFDAIKDFPRLLNILGERAFTWKKAFFATVSFMVLGLALYYGLNYLAA